MFKDMVHELWQAEQSSGEMDAKLLGQEIIQIDRKITRFLDRIADTDSETLLNSYETQVTKLEHQKAGLKEKIAKCGRMADDFDETYRTAFDFLSNPWKYWASEDITDKRTVLQLAFQEPLRYKRNEGYRTAAKSMPLYALEGISNGAFPMVVGNGLASNFSDSFLEEFQACNDLFEHPPIPMGKQYVWEPLSTAA